MASTLREDILRAAIEHIAVHGPDTLSFRQLAADAGVSHQAPYHHFHDRQGVFRAIAGEGFAIMGEAFRATAPVPVDNASEDLFVAYVEFALDHPGHFRVMFRRDLYNLDDFPETKSVADLTFDALVNQVRHDLGKGASIKKIRARATAQWSLAHGLSTLLIDGPLEKLVGPVGNRRAFLRSVVREFLGT